MLAGMATGESSLDTSVSEHEMNPCLERTFRGHKGYITSVSFNPTLTKLASGSADNSVMMWNFKPQLRAFKYIGHTDRVND